MTNFVEDFGYYENFVYRERKPSNRLVYGVGINDSPFQISPTISGSIIIHPAYRAWCNMLTRCYSSKCKEKYPTYEDVVCCTEWLTFTTFAKWFKDNYKFGYHLDKDLLLKDNKVYSPTTCVFAPKEVNAFMTLSSASRGKLPLGVSVEHLNKFRASIKSKYICTTNTKEEAHKAWQKAKLEQAIAFNFPPLQRVIDQLKFEIENNLETTSL